MEKKEEERLFKFLSKGKKDDKEKSNKEQKATSTNEKDKNIKEKDKVVKEKVDDPAHHEEVPMEKHVDEHKKDPAIEVRTIQRLTISGSAIN